MQVQVYPTHEELSEYAANLLLQCVKENAKAVLCLAAGDTPLLTYQKWVKKLIEEKIDYQQCHFIGLDEWVGISPKNSGSCHYFLQKNIFNPLKINKKHIDLFDALNENRLLECDKMNAIIDQKGGIDFMLVGVGMNGHIGFNEPHISFEKYAHVIDLDEKTQNVGQKYFKKTTTLSQGITLGLKHFLEAKQAVVVVNGEKKATIVQKMLEEPVSALTPASIVRQHQNGIVVLDIAAASLLKTTQSCA
jgi:glucosamine-6-phosphate isomerase